MKWKLDDDLDKIRDEFPILSKCVYLLSNSLGAVPRKTKEELDRFYSLWAEFGAGAWDREWWGMANRVGNAVSQFLGGEKNSVTMQSNATQCHWIALSTQFKKNISRNKIIMTDHEFPSVIYAIHKIAEFTGWTIDMVESQGEIGIDAQRIIDRIDDNTLFVSTSHVCFKTAFVQDISQIAKKAKTAGALTLIDGYHAPGTIPVNLNDLNVDFYIGGCLKWLCGGPGNAFLYVRPELSRESTPILTGWFAHKSPLDFDIKMEYTQEAYRFLSGTPPIPSLYTAITGLNIVKEIGIQQIRKKSSKQTSAIIQNAKRHGFKIFSSENSDQRGGAVSLNCPHAFQVRQALEERGFILDFRKGQKQECDVLRIAPHFYSKDEEIDQLFEAWEDILHKKTYEKYSSELT